MPQKVFFVIFGEVGDNLGPRKIQQLKRGLKRSKVIVFNKDEIIYEMRHEPN